MHSDHRSLNRLSRRVFLRSTASYTALAQLRWMARATVLPRQSTFAYVACGQNSGSQAGSLQVFSLHSRPWTAIQRVPTRVPVYVVLSPDEQTLYVANQVDSHKGLPRGTIEAFRINPSDGRLRLLNRQALSLSATHPRHIALSPDGRLLAVAADGGAIYNLLPVSADGSLNRPCSIFKQSDCALHARLRSKAHPQRLLFDTTGNHLLSSGFGGDCLSTFAVAQSPISRRMRQLAANIDDLGAYALHPDGSIIYVWHKIENSLSCYRYDSASGAVEENVQKVSMSTYYSNAASLKTLAIHPSGRMLYTAETTHSRLQAWHINVQDGLLSPAKHIEFDGTPDNEMIVASKGNSLFVLNCLGGLIHRIAVDSVTGEPGFIEDVIKIHGAQSMAFKTF
jgi:6-phosphogluconolactonase